MNCSISASLPYQDKELELFILWHLLELAVMILQFCRDYSKEERNRKVYKNALISYLAHRGPHGSFYGQAVRSGILVGTVELRLSWVRALRSAVSSPRIRSLLKTTRLA